MAQGIRSSKSGSLVGVGLRHFHQPSSGSMLEPSAPTMSTSMPVVAASPRSSTPGAARYPTIPDQLSFFFGFFYLPK
jgi:hypothetical protein